MKLPGMCSARLLIWRSIQASSLLHRDVQGCLASPLRRVSLLAGGSFARDSRCALVYGVAYGVDSPCPAPFCALQPLAAFPCCPWVLCRSCGRGQQPLIIGGGDGRVSWPDQHRRADLQNAGKQRVRRVSAGYCYYCYSISVVCRIKCS